MLDQLREDVWKYNLELPKRNLVVMTSGNISGRDRESNYAMLLGQPIVLSDEQVATFRNIYENLYGQRA